MAGESKLQAKIRTKLKSNKWLVMKVNLCSLNGWPDLYALREGRSVWLEIKDPTRKTKPKPLQDYIREKIIYHGGESYKVVNYDEFLSLKLI